MIESSPQRIIAEGADWRFLNELKKEFLLSIQGKLVMAPNSGVLYGKLRQMAQGAVFDTPDYKPRGEKTPWIRVHDMKLDALENLLEELNGEPAF